MIACICGGTFEAIAMIVTGISACITWVVNKIRLRRRIRAHSKQIVKYAQQSNEELAA